MEFNIEIFAFVGNPRRNLFLYSLFDAQSIAEDYLANFHATKKHTKLATGKVTTFQSSTLAIIEINPIRKKACECIKKVLDASAKVK